MSDAKTGAAHPNHDARENSLKYLYQCEIEKIYFFNESHFDTFAEQHKLPAQTRYFARQLVGGTMNRLTKIDAVLRRHSQNWSVERMPIIDRSIMRLATYELARLDTPVKVVINEAIDLAKQFGTENSGGFVNGILDKVAKEREAVAGELA